jgi:predicted NAD/FAD-binding protein
MSRKTIAIVGSGISGMACARLLYRRHDITLFEKDARIGGHSNTLHIKEDGRDLPVDTGFMVYNEVTYPLLTRLFAELDVPTKPTSMSFSVRHHGIDLEFNGGSLNLLFGQRKNLLRPGFWRMLFQINRFNRETVEELRNPRFGEMDLAGYVEARGYGAEFLDWYLAPMAAAVWSSPPERIREFPARTLMRFWHNHGFLGLDTQHPWRTVDGGSVEYVRRLTAPFRDRIHTGSGVRAITADNRVLLDDGSSRHFDLVVSAAHADQSLGMLEAATAMERELLAPFRYQENHAVLHSDERFMPRNRRNWASWNYRIEDGRHSTHYWMNNLQGVSRKSPCFVSINPHGTIAPDRVHASLVYHHPLFDVAAVAAQQRLPELHDAGAQSGRYFCGAWQRHGFHEDGLWAAHRLCDALLSSHPGSGG